MKNKNKNLQIENYGYREFVHKQFDMLVSNCQQVITVLNR